MPAIRVFFVEDGKVRRVPLKLWEQLHRDERLMPECAGKKMKYALVIVDTEDRKAVGVRTSEFGILEFDQRGGIDQEASFEGSRLISEAVSYSLGLEKGEGPVVQAAGRFAQKAYADRFKWKPTPQELDSIRVALWGKAGE